MMRDPVFSFFLGLPFWMLLPIARWPDMAEGAALAALAWCLLLLAALSIRRPRGSGMALLLPLLLFPPLPASLVISASFMLLLAWQSRTENAFLAAISIPPLMAISATALS